MVPVTKSGSEGGEAGEAAAPCGDFGGLWVWLSGFCVVEGPDGRTGGQKVQKAAFEFGFRAVDFIVLGIMAIVRRRVVG